jgi:polyisoprenoid-binding protein YceI
MGSTWSDNDRLTGHLKSPDFFDVEKFAESTFKLTSATPAEGADQYTMVGDFTLHGVTKTISFPATIKQAGENITLASKFSIDRKDFGIVYPGKTDDLIRDGIVIKLDLTAEPKA